MRLIDGDAIIIDLLDRGIEGVQTDDYAEFLQIIEDAPTVDAVPVRHGRWIPVTNGRGGSECNQCRGYAPSYQSGAEYNSPYCPNCGAKMDGGVNDGKAD